MKIYTSYFAKLNKLPASIIPISICVKAPDWYSGLQYKVLAPPYSLLKHWKENKDVDYYRSVFYKEVLENIKDTSIIKDLCNLSGGKDVALFCYEKPFDFCHRYLEAAWLSTNENLV